MKLNYQITSGKDIYTNKNIVELLDNAFGNTRLSRPIYKLRPLRPNPELSFALNSKDEVNNPVCVMFFWPVILPSNKISLLLGPIAVKAKFKNRGYSTALTKFAIQNIKNQNQYSSVCVSGLKQYYSKLDFVSLPKSWIIRGGSTPPLQLMILHFNNVTKENINNYSGEIKPVINL